MINEQSLRAVAAARRPDGCVQPLYDSYCFARIPATVRRLLGADDTPGLPPDVLGPLDERYDCVVFLFIDSFGWRFFERFGDMPFIRRVLAEGVVSQTTPQFPSTTAAHVTTIHTGLPIGASGVFEWFYYEPLLDAMIAPLLFSFAGDRGRNTLRPTGIAPEQLYPQTTLYQQLAAHGVRSVVFQHRDYAHSPFSRVVCAGSETVAYGTLAEALVNLADAIRRRTGRAYFFFYYEGIDANAHRYGPDSPQVAAEIDLFLTAIERVFLRRLAGNRARALVLLSADHGHAAIKPATTIYLNQAVPEIAAYLRRSRDGAPLVPAGSSRDFFLYIADGRLDEAQVLLRERLAGRAAVEQVRDLLAQGLFGPGPYAPAFLARVGDLVILPHPGEAVWWYEHDRFEQTFYGMHGGLSPDEMETPLLAWVV
jgi:hypothetical protein